VQVQAQGIAPRRIGHHAAATCQQIGTREAGELMDLVGQ
jgi:hypothetical protein